jgi:hypothetical protein
MVSPAVSPQIVSSGAPALKRVPWYIWSCMLGVTSAMVGVHWDIAWHRSIGRDTFWTPAHIAIYLCGILAGISCGYLILRTTYTGRESENSVRIWGFCGPLGAFIIAWGGIAMLASAPFDDWWHGAYGLDVKILSPPHVVLASGVTAIQAGTLILILGAMNRARDRFRELLNWCFLYVGGMLLVGLTVIVLEYTSRVHMHTGLFYRVTAMVAPVVLTGVAVASGKRWAATVVAGVYSVLIAGLLWVLPLFPAEPKLGPVYNPVTHFIPSGFPLLFVAPALALDSLWSRTRRWNRWVLAALSGLIFLAIFFAVQWPFADFLMSPASRNWVFGTHYLDYATRPESYMARNLFVPFEPSGHSFRAELLMALAIAIVTSRIGLAWGSWMQRVRR